MTHKKKHVNDNPLLVFISLCKVDMFLTSVKKNSINIEVNKEPNPAFLLGIAFKIAYWHRKYHSGTICNGVNNGLASNALSVSDKGENPKCVSRKYKHKMRNKPIISLIRMKGENMILLLVFNLIGLLEELKCK
jgi:hypothetical protein